jgi:polar amino acid transport system permease protein
MEDGAHIARFLLPLLEGARITLVVSAGAFVVAVALGLALATLRYFLRSSLVRIPITIYVEIFRNVPSLTHLFLIFFGLAYVGRGSIRSRRRSSASGSSAPRF